ncbi:MAG: hypothetical protein CM15mV22_2290 [Eurybiavirus sp.]|nr:MAG: hypothetical protein CM15mV22_2290 [Eurybiavirus sp.]
MIPLDLKCSEDIYNNQHDVAGIVDELLLSLYSHHHHLAVYQTLNFTLLESLHFGRSDILSINNGIRNLHRCTEYLQE